MTFLSQLAQYYTTYEPTYTTATDAETAAAAAALTGVFVLFTFFVAAIAYVIGAIFLSRIFKKAGVKPYIAWIPFYNNWKMLEIGGQHGYWAVLTIVPIVGYVASVFMYIAMYQIGKKLGKSGSFVLLAIFLPIVWLIWLATDSSKWNDALGTAPSLHTPEVTPAAPTATV